MAAYGSGYYGGGNYSFGVSLGLVEVSSTSSATAAAVRYAFGEVSMATQSVVVIDGVRVAFISASVASEATMVVGSNVIVNQALTITGNSSEVVAGIRIAQSQIPMSCASIFAVDGNLKWQVKPDTAETWTPIADTSEIWTPV